MISAYRFTDNVQRNLIRYVQTVFNTGERRTFFELLDMYFLKYLNFTCMKTVMLPLCFFYLKHHFLIY